MNWTKEAQAVIDDVKPLVNKISISSTKESSNFSIFLDIETLDGKSLLVRMGSDGFSICNDKEPKSKHMKKCDTNEKPIEDEDQDDDPFVYETIYALLSDNCSKYQESFSKSLMSKLNSIPQNQDTQD